jgi:hypothetical protein
VREAERSRPVSLSLSRVATCVWPRRCRAWLLCGMGRWEMVGLCVASARRGPVGRFSAGKFTYSTYLREAERGPPRSHAHDPAGRVGAPDPISFVVLVASALAYAIEGVSYETYILIYKAVPYRRRPWA